MLRSLVCTSSLPWSPLLPLERWCRDGDWESVLAYLREDSQDRDNVLYSCGRSHRDGLLSSAIRCTSGTRRVPLTVVLALYKTDSAPPISKTSSSQGNGHQPLPKNHLLHEAIQYQATLDVVEFLLHAILRSGCYHCPRDLMCSTDHLGRTPLHLLILRWQHQLLRHPTMSITEQQWGLIGNTEHESPLQSITTIFRLLCAFIDACPEVCALPDSDGITPLIQLLQTTVPTMDEADDAHYYQQLQRHLDEAICYMLKVYPAVALTAAQRPVSRGAIPWRNHASHHLSSSTTCSHNFHMPLYYALLHGWCAEIIQQLVQIMTEQQGDRPRHCPARFHEEPETDAKDYVASPSTPTIVTPFYETYLHVAISVHAPASVLAVLVEYEPAAAGARDCYNLNPLDWLWISRVRQVRQAATGQHRSPSSRVSRRRYLASDFLNWHEQVASSVRTDRDVSDADQRLLSSMKVLLPATAAVMCKSPVAKSWNWLHAAFAISCPRPMRELALRAALHRSLDGDVKFANHIDTFLQCDVVNGRTLLHHAVAAVEPYTAVLPVGVSRGIKLLRETFQFWTVQRVMNREASTVVDNAGQLPLHIAIDAFKEYRRATASNASASCLISLRQTVTVSAEVETEEDKILDLLILLNPYALEQADSKTSLIPCMQSAVGQCARLTTIYNLVRRVPQSAVQQI